MASKPRPDQTIRKCKHCGWTYIESCDCRRYAKPTRRRPTDTERLTWLLKGGCTKEYTYYYSKYAYEIRYRQQIDRLMREEARAKNG